MDKADKILDFPWSAPLANYSSSRGSHLCSSAVISVPPSPPAMRMSTTSSQRSTALEIPVPATAFTHVRIDMVDPLPPSWGLFLPTHLHGLDDPLARSHPLGLHHMLSPAPAPSFMTGSPVQDPPQHLLRQGPPVHLHSVGSHVLPPAEQWPH